MSKDSRCILIVLIFIISVYEIHSWYGRNYCHDVVIPIRCSK